MKKIRRHKDSLATKIDKLVGEDPFVHGCACILLIALSILGPVAIVFLSQ